MEKIWRIYLHDFNDSAKRNLILAVSSKDIIYWELKCDNIKEYDFKLFIEKIIQNIAPSERKNFLIFMDNASIHLSFAPMNFYFENDLKFYLMTIYIIF